MNEVRSRRVRAPLLAALPVLGLLVVGLSGCEERARSNPFDPGNPRTGGEPALLQAVAGNLQVRLYWDLASFEDVRGIRLLRRIGEGPEETAHEAVGRGSGFHLDLSRENGTTLEYRLRLFTAAGESLSTATELVTPGGSEVWLGDAGGNGLVRLSPDGRDVLFRQEGYRDLLDLELEPDGSVWGADYGTGQIIRWDREGSRTAFWNVYGANTLALDPTSAQIWVGAFDQRSVFLFGKDGVERWVDSTAGWVEQVRAIPSGGVWTCSREGTLRMVRDRQVLIRLDLFVQPVGLAVEADGSVWVADRGDGSVSRIHADGLVRELSPGTFDQPVDIEVDGSGGAWVADRGRGGVVHLRQDLTEDAFLSAPGVEAVRWDPVNQRLWLCLPARGRLEVHAVEGEVGRWTFSPCAALDLGGRPICVRGLWRH